MTSELSGDEAGLLAALRAGAAGSWPEEAAIGLLVSAAPSVWWDPRWRAGVVYVDQITRSGELVTLAEIDWSAAVTAARRVPDVPKRQVAVVEVAAAIVAGLLGAGLDPGDLPDVVEAIGHAVQGPPTY